MRTGLSGFSFHASPASGWLNDPNGLVWEAGQWTLFAQHGVEPPEFRRKSWARFTSSDLLDWRFEGVAMPAEAQASMYSGCVTRDAGRWTAHLTRHDEQTRMQSQIERLSTDQGRTWSEAKEIVPGRSNVRDPFVFVDGSGARFMLLAAPCDWTGWQDAPPSRLLVMLENGDAWSQVGEIGPWSEQGVIWEVPVLLQLPETDVLLISMVDRRDGGARSGVRAWAGHFCGGTFQVRGDWPADGQRVDLGPDFYAVCAGSTTGVRELRPLVAWMSSWQTARVMPWPGMAGGPITLPRVLAMSAQMDRLEHRAFLGIAERFAVSCDRMPEAGLATIELDGDTPFLVRLTSEDASLVVAGDPSTGALVVERRAPGPLAWRQVHERVLTTASIRTMRVFVDGSAVEVLLDPDGQAITAGVPCSRGVFHLDVPGTSNRAKVTFARLQRQGT